MGPRTFWILFAAFAFAWLGVGFGGFLLTGDPPWAGWLIIAFAIAVAVLALLFPPRLPPAGGNP